MCDKAAGPASNRSRRWYASGCHRRGFHSPEWVTPGRIVWRAAQFVVAGSPWSSRATNRMVTRSPPRGSPTPSGHGIDDCDQVVGALRGRVAPTVAVGVRRISAADVDRLRPEEVTTACSMAPLRLVEFATRAHAAPRLGLGSGPRRSRWSPRRAGPCPRASSLRSLDDDEVAIVVATRGPLTAARGVDLEPAAAVTSDIADIVRRRERARRAARCRLRC